MEYWYNGEALVGSAGILPAAAGMLPAAFCRRRSAPVRDSFSEPIQAVWQDARHGGQHARAPFHDSRFTM